MARQTQGYELDNKKPVARRSKINVRVDTTTNECV
jgi:hypothetical protein